MYIILFSVLFLFCEPAYCAEYLLQNIVLCNVTCGNNIFHGKKAAYFRPSIHPFPPLKSHVEPVGFSSQLNFQASQLPQSSPVMRLSPLSGEFGLSSQVEVWPPRPGTVLHSCPVIPSGAAAAVRSSHKALDTAVSVLFLFPPYLTFHISDNNKSLGCRRPICEGLIDFPSSLHIYFLFPHLQKRALN